MRRHATETGHSLLFVKNWFKEHRRVNSAAPAPVPTSPVDLSVDHHGFTVHGQADFQFGMPVSREIITEMLNTISVERVPSKMQFEEKPRREGYAHPRRRRSRRRCRRGYYCDQGKKMSWDSVPDELIAHITSHMEHSDVCNLMKTTKRHYNVVRAYGKDKIKMDTLTFVDAIGSKQQYFQALCNEGQELAFLTCKHLDEKATLAVNVKNVLEKCSSVGSICFRFHRLTTDLYKVLMETNTKIGQISVNKGQIKFGGKELVSFCQKFRECSFDSCSFETEIWTDDILVPVIAAATDMFWPTAGPHEVVESATLVTDRTLRALFGGSRKMCCIAFKNVHNSYTIKEIVKLIEGLKNGNYKLAEYCDLGILQSDQFIEAERYFNEDTGELRHDYKIDSYNKWFISTYYVVVGGVYNNQPSVDDQIIFSAIVP